MIKKFFQWLFDWPDRDHHEPRGEMTADDLFHAWAFGWPPPKELEGKFSAWNARHSDLLLLDKDGKPSDDLKKMRALYEEHLKMRGKHDI